MKIEFLAGENCFGSGQAQRQQQDTGQLRDDELSHDVLALHAQ
jgi:hypothetical protein